MIIVLDWQRDTLRTRARIVIAMLALPVAYQVFRMGYYGSFVSNTAIAKEGSSTNWARGWEYFWDFVRPYGVWLGVFILAVGAYIPLGARLLRERARRSLCVVVVFIAGTVGNVLYVVAVGGDYQHARLLLPAYFALCAPVAVVPAIRQTAASALLVPWVLATALVLRPPQWTTSNFLANGTVLAKTYGAVTTNDIGWNAGGPKLQWYTGPGYYEQSNPLVHIRRDIPLRRDVHSPVGAFFAVSRVTR
jgi:arabinofuranosyltransferase